MNESFNFRTNASEFLISNFQNLPTSLRTSITSEGTVLTVDKFKQGLRA